MHGRVLEQTDGSHRSVTPQSHICFIFSPLPKLVLPPLFDSSIKTRVCTCKAVLTLFTAPASIASVTVSYIVGLNTRSRTHFPPSVTSSILPLASVHLCFHYRLALDVMKALQVEPAEAAGVLS